MSGWDLETIYKERAAIVAEYAAELDRAQLLARITELETALYPFVTTLNSLDQSSWSGTMLTSKLFPVTHRDGSMLVYNASKDRREYVPRIEEDQLHQTVLVHAESILITDGTKLDDRLPVLSVHQQTPGAYVDAGEIKMQDIRLGYRVLQVPGIMESTYVTV